MNTAKSPDFIQIGNGPAIKILVVDDEQMITSLVAAWFTADGYECAVANSTDEALAHLEANHCELVVTDILMPGRNGLELLEEIGKKYPDTAVIMVTGIDAQATADQALRLGAYGYIIKPLERNELLIHAANALERRRLTLAAKDSQRNLEEQLHMRTEEIALRLISASVFRDEETGAHIRRLGLYSEALAARLGWSPDTIDQIRLAAPMHDVGKIGVPDHILRKAGKLTPEEFEIIKDHTLIGKTILEGSDIPFMKMAQEIAMCHHEKWDGSGYPSFLSGSDIPESARIVAIADVYDALSNDRVYRPALPEDEVLDIMGKGRGSHFDPVIFDRFLSILPQFRLILVEHDNESGVLLPDPLRRAWPQRNRRRFQPVGMEAGQKIAFLQQENLAELLINAIPSPFCIIDAATHEIVLSNSARAKGENASGKKCYAVSHHRATPCEGENHLCPLKIVRETHRDTVVEHIHQDGTGQDRYVEIHGYPLLDNDGNLTHMVEFSFDITARKQAVKQLLKKNQELKEAQAIINRANAELLQKEKMAAIGQLAAGVAHEINNPVGYVASNLGTLAKYVERFNEFIIQAGTIAGPAGKELSDLGRKLKIDFIREDAKDLIKECLEGTERVSKIVQNLKSFSRTDAEKRESADINECLESAVNIVWNELKYKAEVNKDYGTLPRITCYPNQLSQVFMNLLVNAAYAIEKNGRIDIKTRQINSSLLVSIADNGCGVAPENQAKIFEPFFTTKPAGIGTGLGLSIVSEIVARHDGRIEIDSTVGKGTTFNISIPLADQKTVSSS